MLCGAALLVNVHDGMQLGGKKQAHDVSLYSGSSGSSVVNCFPELDPQLATLSPCHAYTLTRPSRGLLTRYGSVRFHATSQPTVCFSHRKTKPSGGWWCEASEFV